MAGVWVYAEYDAEGKVDRATLALLAAARPAGDELAAVALGPGATAAAATLGAHGATTVYASEDPVFADCPGEPAAHVLNRLAAEHAPELLLFGSSYDARDVAGRLQTLLGSALVANADELLDRDHVRLVVPLLLTPGRPGNLRGGIGGDKLVDVELAGPTPHLVQLRPRPFEAAPGGGSAEVVMVDVPVPDERRCAHRRARYVEEGEGPRLEDAPVVVAGGRGLQSAENFVLLEELAATIGNAAVGATRPVVDAGWAPFAWQIGQTGKTVRPAVYIAVGISGAAQHMVGARDATFVIAINPDRKAPIFQYADLGIVGDGLTVVPALVEELSRR